jgi:hypothetical protein
MIKEDESSAQKIRASRQGEDLLVDRTHLPFVWTERADGEERCVDARAGRAGGDLAGDHGAVGRGHGGEVCRGADVDVAYIAGYKAGRMSGGLESEEKDGEGVVGSEGKLLCHCESWLGAG